MNPLFELPVDLTGVAAGDIARALHRQVRSAILDGRLRPGARLPPSRAACAVFGVSRTTVTDLYVRLVSDGLATSRTGSGTFVADPVPRPLALQAGDEPAGPDPRLNPSWLGAELSAAIGFWRERTLPAPRVTPGSVDFRPGLVDSRLFPFDLFRQSTARQLRRMERRPAGFRSPQGNQGSFRLRDAIAEHLGIVRAVACRPEDVLVTAGAQQAFDILARTLLTPDRRVVAVEDPGYPPMRAAFIAAGARIVPVPVDAEGLVVDDLPADASVVCVCPSHHFPLGMTMSPGRRKALLEWARLRGAVVVEDDYDSEFRHGQVPVGALRTGDAADVVFYVGTFSKCMLPSLRLGYVVAPHWAMPTLTIAKNCLDWHCSVPLQLGVAGFIEDGHLARHVTKMRSIYSDRREALLAALRGHEDWLTVLTSSYGMHVATRLIHGDADRISESVLDRDVLIHSLSRYYLAPAPANGFVIGFGASDVEGVSRGVQALRDCLVD